jgi:cytochrome P450
MAFRTMAFADIGQGKPLAVLLSVMVLYFIGRATFQKGQPKFWSSQPNIGLKKQPFAWLIGTLRSVTRIRGWARQGYNKYSKSNIPFTIPTMDRGRLVIIPPQQIKKVYALTDTVLDVHDTQNENLQMKWTVWDKHVIEERLQVNVIHNQLNKNLAHVTTNIYEEIEFGFKRMWGTSNEWTDVHVWDTSLRIIAGAANGVFCGKPLCRNPEFLDALRDHAMGIFGSALVIGCTPNLFKPIPGAIAAATCQYLFRRAAKMSLPFIKERLDNTAKLKADPSFDWTPPNDGLQWIIDECYTSGNPSQLDPGRVCHRLLLINDVSLHTTSFTMQDFILNLFSTDPSLGYVEILREECAAALEEAGGTWTRQAIDKLKLVDSAIRESMRLSPVGQIMLPRKVIHPEGLSLDNASDPVPPGTDISVPIEPIHHDEAIYKNALGYEPFRFAEASSVLKIQERLDSKEKTGATKATNLVDGQFPGQQKSVPRSTVVLDETFLGFGVSGKHACPGRFFALVEMKLFVAYLLLNYEVEFLKERPKPVNVIWLNHPSNASVRVRRVTAF